MIGDYYKGVFKLILMYVISVAMYYFLKDMTYDYVTKEMVHDFIFNIRDNGLSMEDGTHQQVFFFINYSLRLAAVSLLIYTVVHWMFRFLEFQPLVYSIMAYVTQQSYYIYNYNNAWTATNAAASQAQSELIYLSIGAILACGIYNAGIKIPNHIN